MPRTRLETILLEEEGFSFELKNVLWRLCRVNVRRVVRMRRARRDAVGGDPQLDSNRMKREVVAFGTGSIGGP